MNWNAVSQKLYERSDKKVYRTSKQCREHYMCFLKPNLKKYKFLFISEELGPNNKTTNLSVCFSNMEGNGQKSWNLLKEETKTPSKTDFSYCLKTKVKLQTNLTYWEKSKEEKKEWKKPSKISILTLKFQLNKWFKVRFKLKKIGIETWKWKWSCRSQWSLKQKKVTNCN